jgi:hypothetical protein
MRTSSLCCGIWRARGANPPIEDFRAATLGMRASPPSHRWRSHGTTSTRPSNGSPHCSFAMGEASVSHMAERTPQFRPKQRRDQRRRRLPLAAGAPDTPWSVLLAAPRRSEAAAPLRPALPAHGCGARHSRRQGMRPSDRAPGRRARGTGAIARVARPGIRGLPLSFGLQGEGQPCCRMGWEQQQGDDRGRGADAGGDEAARAEATEERM